MKHAVKNLHFVGVGGQSGATPPAKLAAKAQRMRPPLCDVWSGQ
jgi:hypothetical protein